MAWQKVLEQLPACVVAIPPTWEQVETPSKTPVETLALCAVVIDTPPKQLVAEIETPPKQPLADIHLQENGIPAMFLEDALQDTMDIPAMFLDFEEDSLLLKAKACPARPIHFGAAKKHFDMSANLPD